MLRRFLFHNFAYIYRSDQWFRHHFTPAGKLIIGLCMAAGIFGVDTRQTLSFQIMVFTLVLLFAAMLAALGFRARLQIRRTLPLLASVGEPLRYRMRITNHTAHIQRGLSVEEVFYTPKPSFEEFNNSTLWNLEQTNWFDNYVGYPRWTWLLFQRKGSIVKEHAMPELAVGASCELRMELIPIRRGMIYFSGVRLSKPDPLGIFKALRILPCADQLLVLPKRYIIPPLHLPGRRKYQPGGVNLAMSVGDSEEFLALREYRPGDPLRHIHWNSWAKLNKPVVKEFQDEFFVRHALVLDTFVHGVSHTHFEEAVSVASSLACSVLNQDTLLDLLFIGHQAFTFTSGRGVGHLDQLLKTLACVTGCLDQPFSSLSQLLRQHLQAISGTILILIAWDEARQNLVRMLQAQQVPSLVVVICDQPAQNAEFPHIRWLCIGQIQQDLQQLSFAA